MFSHFECTVKHSHFCQITNTEELRLPITIILDTSVLSGKDSTYKIHTRLSGSSQVRILMSFPALSQLFVQTDNMSTY